MGSNYFHLCFRSSTNGITIITSRGKKRTNRKEQIELLNELHGISEENKLGPGMSIKIKFGIVASLFDYNAKMSDAMKPEFWEKCMVGVEELLDLVAEHDDITTGEHILEESELLEAPPYKVRRTLKKFNLKNKI